MVVISAGVVSKSDILVSRQFLQISRYEIESLYFSFMRLIEIEPKDRTFIDTDSARFLYLPLEHLYLVIVTNPDSNILEDLETLKLMQQVIQTYCKTPIEEKHVVKAAFDIIFAFDEIITLGYRENVTLNQIKAYTEMESVDEKLSLLIEEEKVKEERKRGQEIAARFSQERREKAKQEQSRIHKQSKLGLSPSISTPTNPPLETPSYIDITLPALESQSGFRGISSNKGMNLHKSSPINETS